MTHVQKEIYLDLISYLEGYGFRLYKGKIWKYNSSIGYVMAIEVELTKWGTLNDIYVCASSFQSPISENYPPKNEPLLSTWLNTCSYLRNHEGINIYSMGNPSQSANATLKQQYNEIIPYLVKNIFPILQFDHDIKTYLKNMESLLIMECDAGFGVYGVRDVGLALDYFRFGYVEKALQITNLNISFCEERIRKYQLSQLNLSTAKKEEIIQKWEQKRKIVKNLAYNIRVHPEIIERKIEENKLISNSCCHLFFTRYFIK